MMQDTTHCPEGIPSATLAAWHDGSLSTVEYEYIAAHVPECLACRVELATYDRVDVALRGMVAPEPDGRLWQAVRDGMKHGERSMRGWVPRLASGLGAVAAVVLLVLGFAQVLRYRTAPSVRVRATATSAPQGTPTSLPTAIPPVPAVDGPQLNWQQAHLPAPLTDTAFLPFAVAPNDGESAYACNVISDDSGGTLTFYRTSDRALHWTALTQVQVKESPVSIKCGIDIDAQDANRVLMQIAVFRMDNNKRLTWYELSEDGGTTWTRLDASWRLGSLATVNGKTYALRQIDGTPQDLSVSVDHLHSWQSVSQALLGPNKMINHYWLSPSGELLAEVITVANIATPPAAATASPLQGLPIYHFALWRSADGGAHWSVFPTPTLSTYSTFGTLEFVVGQPVAGQPWHMCIPFPPQDGAATAGLDCTFDGGQTWSVRPLLCTIAPCPISSQVSTSYIRQYSSQYVSLYTLASDDAVLVTALAPGATDQNGVSGPDGLYRLPRGSTTWQYLGTMAGSYIYSFAPTPQGGVLWANTGGRNYEALPGLFSTATYP